MQFDKEELLVLIKAVKIMQVGEELLGIDVDHNQLSDLIKKLGTQINIESIKKVDQDVLSLLKEVREADRIR